MNNMRNRTELGLSNGYRIHPPTPDYTQQHMREVNYQQLGALHQKIKALKGLTTDIHTELREQNSVLDVMNDSTGNASAVLKGTMSKLSNVVKSGGNSHMYMLMAFVIFVFLCISQL